MRFKKIIIFTFLIFVLLFSSINIYAAENNVSVQAGPTNGTTFEIDGQITWKEYIQENQPEKFTLTSNGVYWDEYRIVDNQNDFVHPDDLIETKIYYVYSPCNKDHTYNMSLIYGKWLCEARCFRYSCTTCGYSYSEVIEPSTEHSYATDLATYVAPTCTTSGYSKSICKQCGAFKSEEILPLNPEGHITIGATCIDAGTCKYCGVTTTTNSYKHNIVEATCENSSYCLDCGEIFSEPRGHELNVLKRCKLCDYKEEIFPKANEKINTFWGNVKTFFKGDDEEENKGLIGSIVSFFKGDEDKSWGVSDVYRMVLMAIPVVFLLYIIIYFAIKIKKHKDKNLK